MAEYFVIFGEDEKYCTVDRSDVVCDESVKIGDNVTFFWDKSRFTGEVKFMSDDFRQCDKLAETLTADMKKILSRQPSFHADRPRSAKLEGLKNILGKRPSNDNSRPLSGKHSKGGGKNEKKKMKEDRENFESVNLLGKMLSNPSRGDKADDMDYKDSDDELSNTQELVWDNEVDNLKDTKGNRGDLDNGEISSDGSTDGEEKSDSSSSSSSSNSEGDSKKKYSQRKKNAIAAKQINYQRRLEKLQAKIKESGKKFKKNARHSKSNTSGNKKVPQADNEGAFKTQLSLAGHSKSNSSGIKKVPQAGNEGAFKTPEPFKTSPVRLRSIINDGASTSTMNSVHELSPKTASIKTSALKSPSAKNSTSPGKKTPSPKMSKGTIKSCPIAVSPMGKRYDGQMFLVTEPSEEAKELLGPDGKKTGIFCHIDAYERADSASSASSAARQLVTGVFTPDALAASSITGLPPRGKGRESYANNSASIKCYLCPKGVKAIIDQCLEWQKKKGFRPRVECGKIRTSISIRLCELRSKNK